MEVVPDNSWKMYFDGVVKAKGIGIGEVLISQRRDLGKLSLPLPSNIILPCHIFISSVPTTHLNMRPA